MTRRLDRSPLRAPMTVVAVAALAACSRSPSEPAAAAADAAPSAASSSDHAPSPHADHAESVEKDAIHDLVASAASAVKLEPLPPGAPFEGMIRMQVKMLGDDHTPATYTFTLKGKKVRWDLFAAEQHSNFSGYRIYDGSEHRIYTVLPNQKVVTTTDESVLSADAGAPRAWKFTPDPLEPKGGVRDVKCDRKRTQDDQYEYEVCVAPGLVPFPLQFLSGAIEKAVPFNDALEKQGLFPLAVTVKQRGASSPMRALVGTMIALDVNRGRIPDSAFELPNLPRVATTTLTFGSAVR